MTHEVTTRLEIKPGVVLTIDYLEPCMTRVLEAGLLTCPGPVLTITDAMRVPVPGGTFSLHYVGRAVDFRIKFSPDETENRRIGDEWASRMASLLGDQYDVIAHGRGPNFHLHTEYDPK